MGTRPMQESTVELSGSVRMKIDRLKNRIEQLEPAEAAPDHDIPVRENASLRLSAPSGTGYQFDPTKTLWPADLVGKRRL